ncbi:MAG: apolipoprotein N-acyltransferase [Deltaproteobacteria bacterium]|nr:MAG: apolipoprotein N-acyltransferase [Deltaproteobacteria bacterium]
MFERFICPRYLPAAAGLAGGLALVASFPPRSSPLLAVLAWAPVHLACAVRRTGLPSRLVVGLVVGLAVGLLGASWMYGTLRSFAGVGPVVAAAGHLAFALYVAVPFVVATWVWGWLHRAPALLRALAAGAVLAGAEAFVPTAVGYRSAVGLSGAPSWIQLADLAGVSAVTVWQVTCGALIAEGIHALHRRRGRVAVGIALFAWVAANAIYGHVRMAEVDDRFAAARIVRVGLVQPSIPLRHEDRAVQIELLRRAGDAAAAQGAEIVVWPESSYPWAIEMPWRAPRWGPRSPFGAAARPLVLASTTYRRGDPTPENRAFALAADGRVIASYAKVHLLPFGERVPIVDPGWAEAHLPGVHHYRAGEGPVVFAFETASGPLRLGPLICYEDTLPHHATAVAARGIDAFLNLTNDAWFGPTAAPWQHEGLAVFRAVEQRRPMVRVVGTGPSGLVDPAGRIVQHTPVTWRAVAPDPHVLVVDVPVSEPLPPTIHARWGRWIETSFALFGLVCGIVFGFGRRIRQRDAGVGETFGSCGSDARSA